MSEAFDSPAVSERRLAAVLCLDVAGYSSLMEVDEEGTLARLQSIQLLIERAVARGHGRVFGVAGDGFMAEFTSPVAAVRSAIIIQQEVQAANQGFAPMQQMRLRIGAHLGDVMVSGDRLYGDGVNIAARLQAVAEPGGLCASSAIVEHVRGKVGVEFRDIGERVLRNLQTPVRAYTIRIGADASPRPNPGQRRLKTAMVSLLGIFIAGASIYSQIEDPSTILPFRVPAPAARTSDMPSLVVMPFAGSMAADEDMLLADGIAEDLSTDLGKFRTLLVFATDALDLPDGTSQGLADAMRTLKPRYIVEGAVQSLHEQLRINVRLVDGRDGRQIWADRWNRPKKDLFTLQDEITQSVAMALPLELRVAELERIKTRRASNLDSYELWLRARQNFDDPTPDSNLAARRILEQALQLDPGFARARGHLSYTYAQEVLYGWTDDPEGTTARALSLANEAVSQDPTDYDNQWSAGIAYLLAGDFERALTSYGRAAEMNPNDATLLAEMGDALVQAGRPEEAVIQVRRAIARNPRAPGWFYWNLGFAQYMSGDYAGAIATYEAVADLPEEARVDLAAAYAMRNGPGDRKHAASILSAYRQVNPNYTVTVAGERRFARRSDQEHYLMGLRLAGLPEA